MTSTPGPSATALFLSPHPDDVCLSLAGVVSMAAGRKCLVTVFGRSLWVEPAWDGPRDPRSVIETRALEDEAFCDAFGLQYLPLGMEDTSMRHQRMEDLRAPSGDEASLAGVLTDELRELIASEGAGLLVAPLGLGRHPDHAVCAAAALRAAAASRLTLVLYEDLPYARELTAWGIGRHARRLDRSLEPLIVSTGMPLRDKLRAVEAYASQRKEEILLAVVSHSARLARGPVRDGEECAHERLWTRDAEAVRAWLGLAPAPQRSAAGRGAVQGYGE